MAGVRVHRGRERKKEEGRRVAMGGSNETKKGKRVGCMGGYRKLPGSSVTGGAEGAHELMKGRGRLHPHWEDAKKDQFKKTD